MQAIVLHQTKPGIMNRKNNPLIIAAMAVISLAGCKKKEDNPASSASGKAFYCKIDGTEFTPAAGGRFYAFPTGFQIVGDTSYTTIEIYTPSVNVGSYPLKHTTDNDFASVFVNAGSKHYISTDGELKITKSDGVKISGTFHYTATGASGTVNVTDGAFNDIPKK